MAPLVAGKAAYEIGRWAAGRMRRKRSAKKTAGVETRDDLRKGLSSNNQDSRVTYRKKYSKAGIARRKRWKKFQKKVQRAVQADVPTQKYKTHTATEMQIAVDTQRVCSINLNGFANVDHAGDGLEMPTQIATLHDKLTTHYDPNSTTSRVYHSRKFWMKKSRADFVLRNVDDSGNMAVVDMYYLECRRDITRGSDEDVVRASIRGHFGEAADHQHQISTDTATANTGSSIIGITPFDAPDFCKYWKITGKKRLNLSVGEEYTGSLTYNKQFLVDGADAIDNVYFKRKKSIAILFLIRGMLNMVDETSVYSAATVQASVHYTHSFKPLPSHITSAQDVDALDKDTAS